MDFIMPALLKPETYQPDSHVLSRIRYFTFLLLLCASSTLHATQVKINSVQSRVQNNILWVDVDINYELGEEVIEALKNGITLTFYIKIEIYRPRSFMWDKELAHFTQNLELAYHSLSDQYLLTDVSTSDQKSFNSLYDALNVLGKISGLPVTEAKYVDPELPSFGRIQTGIDIDELPAVMRLQAWLSSEWRADSGWYEWEIYP